LNQRPCPGDRCEAGLSTVGGVCGVCGKVGQKACDGDQCDDGVADAGQCVPCGHIDQLACPVSRCLEGVLSQDRRSCVKEFCRIYADTAVAQNASNMKMECGYSGDRWSGNEEGHFNWCKSVAPAAATTERQARDADLAACKPRILENMTDRCSGDVLIAGRYGDDLGTAQRDGILLKRGGRATSLGDHTLRIKGHTWIRWFCHSTTGNWADLATWHLDSGGVSVGCQVDDTTGDVGNCQPINGDFSAGMGNASDWTAERSRCDSENTKFIRGFLGTSRLLRIECWGGP
jgi:hypothetical protein